MARHYHPQFCMYGMLQDFLRMADGPIDDVVGRRLEHWLEAFGSHESIQIALQWDITHEPL